MYKCTKCNKVSNPGDKQNKVVVETRAKVYTNEVRVEEFKRITINSTGLETVREVVLCRRCAP